MHVLYQHTEIQIFSDLSPVEQDGHHQDTTNTSQSSHNNPLRIIFIRHRRVRGVDRDTAERVNDDSRHETGDCVSEEHQWKGHEDSSFLMKGNRSAPSIGERTICNIPSKEPFPM